MRQRKIWMGIALFNLFIVAVLGLLMRTKMIFELPFVEFRNVLQGHSHFAFGGWITLSLFILLVHEFLPASIAALRRYTLLLSFVLLTSLGMLFSFPVQGYGSVSIVFSTAFIFACWAFAFIFIRDLRKTQIPSYLKTLVISALLYLVLSAGGPFTLAYLKASHSTNFILYKDAIYSFLHLQYNGFFTLVIVALALRRATEFISMNGKLPAYASALLNISVIPSLFISYLWHQPGSFVYAIAGIGGLLILAGTILFGRICYSSKHCWRLIPSGARLPLAFAMTALLIKQLCLVLTLVPAMGDQVFANRPLIIAFLHLALLGFTSLYIIAHAYSARLIQRQQSTRAAIRLFSISVLINEIFLFAQGFMIMLGSNSPLFPWLLLAAAVLLVASSWMMFMELSRSSVRYYISKFYSLNHKLIRYENSN